MHPIRDPVSRSVPPYEYRYLSTNSGAGPAGPPSDEEAPRRASLGEVRCHIILFVTMLLAILFGAATGALFTSFGLLEFQPRLSGCCSRS
jgi:hypothetical protein